MIWKIITQKLMVQDGGEVARIRDEKNRTSLVGEAEKKRTFGRPKGRQYDILKWIIKMALCVD